jgi:hypothetical protein
VVSTMTDLEFDDDPVVDDDDDAPDSAGERPRR